MLPSAKFSCIWFLLWIQQCRYAICINRSHLTGSLARVKGKVALSVHFVRCFIFCQQVPSRGREGACQVIIASVLPCACFLLISSSFREGRSDDFWRIPKGCLTSHPPPQRPRSGKICCEYMQKMKWKAFISKSYLFLESLHFSHHKCVFLRSFKIYF